MLMPFFKYVLFLFYGRLNDRSLYFYQVFIVFIFIYMYHRKSTECILLRQTFCQYLIVVNDELTKQTKISK